MTKPKPSRQDIPLKPKSRWLDAFSDGPGMAREILIVVAGVLLAFGADRAGEAMAKAARAKTTEAALKAEVQSSLLHAAEVSIYAACRIERIEQMSAAIREGRLLPSSPPLGARPWTTAAWRSGLASGAAEDLKREKLAIYSRLYGGFEALAERQFQMRNNLIAARAADFPGVTASDRAEAATHLAMLRADLDITARIAEQMLSLGSELDIAPPSRPVDRFRRAAEAGCLRMEDVPPLPDPALEAGR